MENTEEYTYNQLAALKLLRLEQEQLRGYCPHNSQEKFHRATEPVRALFWANQEGKSYCGSLEIAWAVSRSHPFRPNDPTILGPLHARDCCKTNKVLHGTLIPTYKMLLPRKPCTLPPVNYAKWHPKAGKLCYDRTFEGEERKWPGLDGGTWKSAWNRELSKLTLKDGSFIEFLTYDQSEETYGGAQMHIIRMDEEPPEVIYGENQARQIGLNRVNILFTMTPLKYSDWIYGLYVKSATNPKIYASQKAERENPRANQDVLDFIEENVTDPAERAARLRGEFTYSTGRIWKDYGEHNLINPFEIPYGWDISRIIDPHLEKPTWVMWLAKGRDGISYVIGEAEFSGDVEFISQQIRIQESDWMLNLELIDPSAKQSTAIHGKGRLIDEFRKYFPHILEANNNRELGWNRVGNAMKNKGAKTQLRVFRTCTKTDLQFKNYSWKAPMKSGESRGKPEPLKKNDEAPDCIRYYYNYDATDVSYDDFTGFNIKMYANG